MATKKQAGMIEIQEIRQERITIRLIGTTPLYQNRMSQKVLQGLLLGGRKKTAVEKLNIKHNPPEEFRNSAETVKSGNTALGVKTVAIKSAMCDAAIETAGLTKTGTQRLIFMPGDHAPLYGIPHLKCDVTRSADMNRTPDVRTRAYLPRWACEVEVHFVTPQLSAYSIVTLLSNAGILIGVGDYRQQKGKGSYGAFRVSGVEEQDDEWDYLVANCGKAAQLEALANPPIADEETQALMDFYNDELNRRSA